MKKVILAVAILFAGSGMTSTYGYDPKVRKTKKHTTVTKKYTCSMHPEVVMNKPGKCPKCGMKLVLQKKAKATVTR